MINFGCVISIEVAGDLTRVERILTSTRYFHFAVSLGSVESLIQHPYSLTHAVVPEDQKTTWELALSSFASRSAWKIRKIWKPIWCRHSQATGDRPHLELLQLSHWAGWLTRFFDRKENSRFI